MTQWKLGALLAVATFAASALPAATKADHGAAAPSGVININSASAEQISYLPRVGLKLAQRVVEYRKSNGTFKKVEDLMEVKGVGEKLFVTLRPHLSVSGESTLAQKIKSTGMRSHGRAKSAKAA
jgi:competence protein ComEA